MDDRRAFLNRRRRRMSICTILRQVCASWWICWRRRWPSRPQRMTVMSLRCGSLSLRSQSDGHETTSKAGPWPLPTT